LRTSLSCPVPRDFTMKRPRVRFIPSSNSLTTIHVSIKDETPISPLVLFFSLAETRLVKKVVIKRDFKRSIIRERLHLKEGDQFIVIGQGDAVILKAITPPSMDEFEGLLKEARASVKKSNLKQDDVKAAIKKVRKS
ncbi:MAG TPA: hypothetical protein VNJ08_16655, partial [Bacteriovoracaceae bacterium]|nr:hypothetical protein [Bacteriovoracaceae bacterium]